MTSLADFTLRTTRKHEWLLITPQVARIVAASGLHEGICVVCVPHTTAALTLNEHADPQVPQDVQFALNAISPDPKEFRHAEGNSATHTQTSLVGSSLPMKRILQGLLLLVLALLGAGAQKSHEARPALYTAQAKSLARDTGNESLPVTGLGQGRKLVKRAEVQIRVTDPDASEQALSRALDQHGAYTASRWKLAHERNYTIRVPAASYEDLLAELLRMGQVLRDSESAEDVSLTYYDLEGRLATKQELLRTFQSYLGKAKTIEEILSVEARIGELQYEIERLGTEFRSLLDETQYATIELSLSPERAADRSLKARLDELYRSFGDSLSIATIALLGILMYGIPGLLVLGLLYALLWGRIGLLKKLWRILSEK